MQLQTVFGVCSCNRWLEVWFRPLSVHQLCSNLMTIQVGHWKTFHTFL